MKSTKKALLLSITSMLLCVAMLMGTTFAWFTDTVTSGANRIVAGNLDVELWHTSKNVTTAQEIVNGSENLLFKDVEFWEPGAYAYETFTVKNVGDLALKYKMNLNVVGKNDLNGHDLTEVIKVAVSDTVPDDREAAAALSGYTSLETWMLGKDNVSVAATESDTFTVVLYWEPTDHDNLYNVNNENATHDALYLDLGVSLYATQVESESDSFGTDYDKAAALPVNSVAKGELDVTDASTANNAVVKSEQTITDGKGVMSVTYPENVKLSNTTDVSGETGGKKTDVAQKLEYIGTTPSSASITIGDDKAVAQYELTLPVANDNTTPVTVTINYTKNLSGVKVYHSGTELTATANADGESATYDATTGVLTLTLKHASPIDIVYDVVRQTVATVKNATELEAALSNTDIETIKLGDSFALSEVMAVTHSVTIDFCGKTITASGDSIDDEQFVFQVVNNATTSNVLTFKDSVGGGKLTSTYGGIVLLSSRAGFILNDVTIESNKGFAVEIYSLGMVISDDWSGVASLGAVQGASVVMNSGKIITPADGDFSNGAIHGGNQYTTDIENFQKNTIVINGGEIELRGVMNGLYMSEGSMLTINNGTINNATVDTNNTIIFNDGGKGIVEVKGGTFVNYNPSDYVATGYHAAKNDSTWTVVAD